MFYPLLISVSLIITILWWMFLRERIGYILPNPLFAKHRKIPLRIMILWILRFSIIASIMGIILGIGEYRTGEYLKKESHNILIILDISRSMLAEDISPSRIESAKDTINTFLRDRSNDMFGMIVFAGKPIVSIPFSSDTSGISAVISGITPASIRQDLPWLSGTAIGDALLIANSTLSGMTDKSSIILITDGRANVGIDPLIAARETAWLGVPVFTIAIWGTSDQVLSYTDPYTQKRITLEDEKWEPLRSDIDEPLLKNIAEITWGAYFRVTAWRELYGYWDTISERIGKSEKKVTETRYISYRPYLFVFLILLICIERIMTTRVFYKNRAK